jgi:hypothetical protein
VTEEVVVEQALDSFLAPEDASALGDYWLSAASMREYWEAMPEDWIAGEVNDTLSSTGFHLRHLTAG